MAVEGLGKMKAREEHDGLHEEAASLNRRMQENDPLMRSAGADGIIHHVQCQHQRPARSVMPEEVCGRPLMEPLYAFPHGLLSIHWCFLW